ncbi:hypothetical protein DB346_14925 [Verrucomicrobia bacterium LW23]|nr:hypothetical protein DB346_14925 [Verrucomicrobia bacterium LW23]
MTSNGNTPESTPQPPPNGDQDDKEQGFSRGIEGKIAVILIVLFLGGYLFLIFLLKSEPGDRHVQSWLNELDRRVTNKPVVLPSPTNAPAPAP